eukprot:scaffold422776_cov67-Attheya_sp.AAC.2
MTSKARVFDGSKWENVDESAVYGENTPIKPATATGKEKIFVSLPSFRGELPTTYRYHWLFVGLSREYLLSKDLSDRWIQLVCRLEDKIPYSDGKRCGSTLKDLFDKAKHPDKVFVGLIEQNIPKHDKECLVEYCALHGVSIRGHHKMLVDTDKCPHYDQIRLLAVYNIGAKGPSYARSLARKVMENEEYCLQIDAHSSFTNNWDTFAKEDWAKMDNEYGILSTVPANVKDKGNEEVPRQCRAKQMDTGIPAYSFPADGKVEHLQKPLLSRAWSAGFSFAKCHLEESAPYDPFAPLLWDGEQFPRFARYDVYTPTRNIVYHDPEPNRNDPKGWPKQEEIRQMSLKRVQTFLQIDGGDAKRSSQANLGIYGLGKRRTLRQLMDFVGVDLYQRTGNGENMRCANPQWVPYDATISPMQNLYDNANDLDPQPEYPLRKTLLHMGGEAPPPLELAEAEKKLIRKGGIKLPGSVGLQHHDQSTQLPAKNAPFGTMFIIWIIGLFIWYQTFSTKNAVRRKPKRKEKTSGYKSVKNV